MVKICCGLLCASFDFWKLIYLKFMNLNFEIYTDKICSVKFDSSVLLWIQVFGILSVHKRIEKQATSDGKNCLNTIIRYLHCEFVTWLTFLPLISGKIVCDVGQIIRGTNISVQVRVFYLIRKRAVLKMCSKTKTKTQVYIPKLLC